MQRFFFQRNVASCISPPPCHYSFNFAHYFSDSWWSFVPAFKKEKKNTRVRMPQITAISPLLHVSVPTHSPRGTGEGKGPLDGDRWEQENAAGQFLRVRGVGGNYIGVSSLSKVAQWGCGAWNLLPGITTLLPAVQSSQHLSLL